MLAVLLDSDSARRSGKEIEISGYHILNICTSHPVETAMICDRPHRQRVLKGLAKVIQHNRIRRCQQPTLPVIRGKAQVSLKIMGVQIRGACSAGDW